MKLLSKTSIYTSITTVALLLAGITIVYGMILKKINHEETEHILHDKYRVIKLLKEGKPPVHFSSNIGEKISINEIPVLTMKGTQFRDYIAKEERENEDITIREVKFQTQVGEKKYEVTIARSLAEQKEITRYIISTVIIFLIFSLVVLFILNFFISRSIWAPFYQTMAFIKKWSITEGAAIDFKKTNIDEFNELNTSVYGLINKINEDYSNLKEFTENISHETQTPLAIISTKIELLMQESNYSENQRKLLSQSYESIQRLNKLNETLVTLSRIENNQFENVENIDLSVAVKKIIEELAEFIEAKKIHVQSDLIPVKKEINLTVLLILLNNLFINAIKHNLPQNGIITINLSNRSLSIKNSASHEEINKKHLFARFKSYSTSQNSIGLGLSIIKKIADILGWEIKYRYKDSMHEFELVWLKV
ncbi:MAG: HAMP domain-containing sensor histidine kinase [Bacteroidia bacterium]